MGWSNHRPARPRRRLCVVGMRSLPAICDPHDAKGLVGQATLGRQPAWNLRPPAWCGLGGHGLLDRKESAGKPRTRSGDRWWWLPGWHTFVRRFKDFLSEHWDVFRKGRSLSFDLVPTLGGVGRLRAFGDYDRGEFCPRCIDLLPNCQTAAQQLNLQKKKRELPSSCGEQNRRLQLDRRVVHRES